MLLEIDTPQANIAEKLDMPLGEVKACVKRLRAIRDDIDRAHEPQHD